MRRLRARSPRRRIAGLLVLAGSLSAALLPSLATGQEEEVELAEELGAETSPQADRAIAEGLRQRFERLSGLQGVTISVEAGIVRLEGEVESTEASERALEIARRTEGVAGVEDAIEVQVDPGARLRATLEQSERRILELVAYLPLFGLSVLVFVLFVLLARAISRWRAPFARFVRNPFAQELARQVVVLVIVALGALVALELLEATSLVAALLGTAGIAGIAIGFAFRDLAENYISSVLLSLRQPFAPNDHVVIDGNEGLVIRLTSRATILMTLDGNHLRLPNSQVFKATILNYSRNPTRRFAIVVGVSVDADLAEAQRLGIAALEEMQGVMADPPPSARVEALGDSNVPIRYFGWVDQRQHDFLQVHSMAIRRLKLALDAGGVEMPEPIYRVKLDGREAPAPTVKPSAPVPAVRSPGAGERVAAPPSPEIAPAPRAERAHLAETINAEREATREKDLLDPAAPVE
ncbi:MAG TPA: mechanosensitive ion channel family protein [Thermoanaerobaculia bacterium]|nr:mechanosensitive ion channel family protein [Thermoanaerobaculia bacterium]